MKQATHLQRMHKHYGKRHGHTCADCPNCMRWSISRSGHKCICYDASPEEETNWSPDSAACGHHGRLFDEAREKPVYKMYRRSPGPCAGQETLPMEEA